MLTAVNGGATVAIREFDTFVNERPAGLTRLEHKLVGSIAKGAGKVRTHRMLLQDIYPDGNEAELKIFDVIFCKVRAKLDETHVDAGALLRRVWGRGFVFGPPRAAVMPAVQDLPVAHGRWVANRKRAIIDGLRAGTYGTHRLLAYYDDLTPEELDEWTTLFTKYGHSALRVTRAQSYAIT